MPLSEHVYCVAIAFKMTERVKQWIHIKFCLKLEHSSAEPIQMIQKAAAMGNWWLAASSWQCACSCFTSHAEFYGDISNHPGDLAPILPRSGTQDFWLSQKTKSPLKRKRFQTFNEIQENMMGQLMAIGKTVWGLKVPSLKGTGCHCPMYNVSCIFYLLQ